MYCISVSYRKTPVEIRQRFSFDIEEQERFLLRLKKAGTIGGGVIVSTCNRSEIYFTGGKHAPEEVIEQLEEEKQVEERHNLIRFEETKSIFDEVRADCVAQYASAEETPVRKWENVITGLKVLY